MPEPRITATGTESMPPRQYNRPMSPADFYVGGGRFEYPTFERPSRWDAQPVEPSFDEADLGANSFMPLPGSFEDYSMYDPTSGTRLAPVPGASRQARITASSRAIENAPYAAAERATEEERQAQLTNMRIEEKQAAEMAAAEARAQEIAAEKIAQNNQVMAAQNESLRLAQEQQALQSGLPIGPSIPFSKKPVVSTPAGMAAAPESRSALAPDQSYISSRVDGLIGSYSKNMPTYTEAKTAGNVGTIDMRADAPVKQEMGGEDYLMQQSIAAAGRGDAQAAQLFGTLAKVSAETAKLRAETSKTKADENRGAVTAEKEMAETVKAYAEADKLMREIEQNGIDSVSPDRLMTSAGTAAERINRDRRSMVDRFLENDPVFMQPGTSDAQRTARYSEVEAMVLRMMKNDPLRNADFTLMESLQEMLGEADTQQKQSSAKSLSNMEPNDPFKLPE